MAHTRLAVPSMFGSRFLELDPEIFADHT